MELLKRFAQTIVNVTLTIGQGASGEQHVAVATSQVSSELEYVNHLMVSLDQEARELAQAVAKFKV